MFLQILTLNKHRYKSKNNSKNITLDIFFVCICQIKVILKYVRLFK